MQHCPHRGGDGTEGAGHGVHPTGQGHQVFVLSALSLQQASADPQQLIRVLQVCPGPATKIFLQGGQGGLEALGERCGVPSSTER